MGLILFYDCLAANESCFFFFFFQFYESFIPLFVTSEQVESCCLALVAKALAHQWKWLGRSLAVPDTKIETINTENESEEERSYQVLINWTRTMGSKATVHALMKAVQEVGEVPPLEAFDRHLGDRHVEAAKTC